MEKLHGSLASVGKLSGCLTGSGKLSGQLVPLAYWPVYEGTTEITPSAGAQILPAAGRHFEQDIIINPIPSNYGLIGWDGFTLTVS